METDVSTDATKDDGPTYSVGFDPLDGSSIIDANFSGTMLSHTCDGRSPLLVVPCMHGGASPTRSMIPDFPSPSSLPSHPPVRA